MAAGDVIGREAELQCISGFVRGAADGSAVLVIEGEAGVGKTTLWQAGRAEAEVGGILLSCRPVETEATLSFAGLGDLFEGVVGGVLGELPAPQRRALEAALLLGDGGRVDHRAVGAATLSTLRLLAEAKPVIVAIDDIQWLDRPSGRALAFAVRRLTTEPVRVLASTRTPSGGTSPPGLRGLLEHADLRALPVGPLSLGATERLLGRLGVGLPRTVLVRLHENSGGNPFFAMELGRALAEAGSLPGPGQPLPVPRDLHPLLLDRVGRLPTEVRRALLLASILSQPTEDALTRAAGESWNHAADLGREAGIIDLTRGSIRFTHPLLAAAVAASASTRERSAAHARLAEIVVEPEERARHLALAAREPDEAVATALEQAAESARRRGAPDAAAELAELARALTPDGRSSDVCRRCIAAGDARFAAGDSSLAAELFGEAAAVAAPGPERAQALFNLARVRYQHDDVMGSTTLLEEARKEAGDDVGLRAAIEHDLVFPALAAGDLRTTLRHALAAADLAEAAGAAPILSGALCQIAVSEFLLGHGVDWDMLDRARSLEDWDEPGSAVLRPSIIAAHILSWTDRIDEARALLHVAERELLERGDEGALPWVGFRLAELDCWSGDWERGYERALTADQLAIQTGQGAIRPPTCYAVALVAAHLGRVDEARFSAVEGIKAASAAAFPVGIAMNVSVLGFLELSLGHPDQAHAHLAPVLAAAQASGVREPGMLWWLGDEIEALVALGDHAEAVALTDWLEERSRAIDRPGGLASAARCRALLAAAQGRNEDALAESDAALRHHERTNLPFATARALFTKGQIARRARKWGVARASLLDALGVFDALGAGLWSARTREELGRVGGRPPRPSELSEGERQIAELVADGRSNREVAEVLFMSPRTVSASLGRAYRKLGVTSRTEMAAVLRRSAPESQVAED